MWNQQNSANLPVYYSAKNIVSGEKPRGYRGDHEKLCECGKYIADEMTKECFACERAKMKHHFLNEK